MKRELETKFYEFSQNNSGGSFDVDENVCHRVIIEAIDAKHAQNIFEPMIENQSGSCPCCGDRWYRADESDGSEVPSIYGEPLEKMEKSFYRENCFVHYLDGTFKKIEFKENSENVTQ